MPLPLLLETELRGVDRRRLRSQPSGPLGISRHGDRIRGRRRHPHTLSPSPPGPGRRPPPPPPAPDAPASTPAPLGRHREGERLAEALPLARVDLLVHQQAAQPGEGLVALQAAVGPLPGVGVEVVPQQVGQPEALVAELALVGLVAGVGHHVALELALLAVALATLSAAIRLLLVQPLVGLHVLEEGEVLAAVRAFEGLLAGVDDQVLLQVAAEFKALPAHLALEGLVPGVDAHVQLQNRTVTEGLAAFRALQGLANRVVHARPPPRCLLCVFWAGVSRYPQHPSSSSIGISWITT